MPGLGNPFRRSEVMPRTKTRRCRANGTFACTFRMGFPGMAGEGRFWDRSVYNEFEKVVEKGRFARHLPDGVPGHSRRGTLLGQVGL